MRRLKGSVVILICFLTQVLVAQSSQLPAAEVEKRVDAILSGMTLEEKIDYIGGVDGFYVRAVPRLSVPRLKMADGPIGVRNYGPSTALAGGIGLAANTLRQRHALERPASGEGAERICQGGAKAGREQEGLTDPRPPRSFLLRRDQPAVEGGAR
jgi:hypothetical protein